MSYTLDPKLEEFATPRQWELLEAWARCGSSRKASAALGVNKSLLDQARRRVEKVAALRGYSPAHDYTHTVPDGFKLRGVSTLYNADGDVVAEWVKSQIDHNRQAAMMREIVAALGDELPRVSAIPAPSGASLDDLCVGYPIGDHHLGMLSWRYETGQDYDLNIGERVLMRATDELVDGAKPAATGLVVFLGDFFHYDSFETVTPTSRNQLDADGRFPKMVSTGLRVARYVIERAAEKHQTVHVIVEPGNHDLASSIWFMHALSSIYANNPRITIDISPMHYHYYRFGKVLLGTHHGHGTKMSNLPLIMAADRPEDWGETAHRYWWTGHIHTSKTQAAVSAQDHTGVVVESFRILAPPDAWAHQKGYRPIQGMKRITFHREFGELERASVYPAMFEEKK